MYFNFTIKPRFTSSALLEYLNVKGTIFWLKRAGRKDFIFLQFLNGYKALKSRM